MRLILKFLWAGSQNIYFRSKINSCQPPNVGRFSVWQVNLGKLSSTLLDKCLYRNSHVIYKTMPNCVLALFMGVCFCHLLSVLGFDAHKLTYTTICVFTHCVPLVLCPCLLYWFPPPSNLQLLKHTFPPNVYFIAHIHGASAVEALLFLSHIIMVSGNKI